MLPTVTRYVKHKGYVTLTGYVTRKGKCRLLLSAMGFLESQNGTKTMAHSAMLKMMAADNDDAYNLSPAFILETVAAAKGFIQQSNANVSATSPTKGPNLEVKIASFLAWSTIRVRSALAQLTSIEDGQLSKKAVESLPTIHAATVLHRQVRKAEARGKPIPKRKQEEIAKHAAQSVGESPARVIEQEVSAVSCRRTRLFIPCA
jgi:hypothetical protein